MRKFASVFLILFLLGILMGFSAQSSFAQGSAAESTKQQLIDKFQTNNKTDHKAAYEAAKQFLQKYPDDMSDTALYMKKWVAAYEKVGASSPPSGNSEASPPPVSSTSPPVTAPTLGETIAFIRKVLNSEDARYTDAGDNYVSNQKVTNYDDCTLEIERFWSHARKTNGDGQSSLDKVKIDLRKTSVTAVVESDARYTPKHFSVAFADGVTGNSTITERSTYYGDRNQTVEVLPTTNDVGFGNFYVFMTKEMAERFRKATDHAITLCKGTSSKDPF
jgi:hypothetical protein